MARADRPLSPHLGVYRWQIANTLSILHRATGVFLSFGALVLSGWLISVAAGFDAYARVASWLAGPIGALLLFGWTFALFYHLCNGIRHLVWDTGRGYELPTVYRSGWLAVIAAAILSVLAWIWGYSSMGAF